jgi:hypothetical protein
MPSRPSFERTEPERLASAMDVLHERHLRRMPGNYLLLFVIAAPAQGAGVSGDSDRGWEFASLRLSEEPHAADSSISIPAGPSACRFKTHDLENSDFCQLHSLGTPGPAAPRPSVLFYRRTVIRTAKSASESLAGQVNQAGTLA